jgi:hypothetical protein
MAASGTELPIGALLTGAAKPIGFDGLWHIPTCEQIGVCLILPRERNP